MTEIYQDLLEILKQVKYYGEYPEGITDANIEYIIGVVGAAEKYV